MVDMAVGVNIGLLMLLLALWAGTIPVSLPWLAGVGIGLCVGLGLTSILLNPAWAHRWAEWLIPSTRWDPDRTALLKRITSWQGLQVTIGTGARYVVFTGQFACLAWALAPSLSAWSVAVAVSLTYYAKYLLPSLTLLDLGIREGAAVYFFTGFGMGGAVGLNAALLLFSINVLVPAALGLPFVPQLSLPAVGSKQPWSHVRSTLVPF